MKGATTLEGLYHQWKKKKSNIYVSCQTKDDGDTKKMRKFINKNKSFSILDFFFFLSS